MIDGIKMYGQQERQAGIAIGLDKSSRLTAERMINAGEPRQKIISYSNLAEDVIESIAASLGKVLA